MSAEGKPPSSAKQRRAPSSSSETRTSKSAASAALAGMLPTPTASSTTNAYRDADDERETDHINDVDVEGSTSMPLADGGGDDLVFVGELTKTFPGLRTLLTRSLWAEHQRVLLVHIPDDHGIDPDVRVEAWLAEAFGPNTDVLSPRRYRATYNRAFQRLALKFQKQNLRLIEPLRALVEFQSPRSPASTSTSTSTLVQTDRCFLRLVRILPEGAVVARGFA